MNICSTVQPGAGFLSSMTGYLDCQANLLGSGAWQALGMPGSTFQVVLAGFLTIFIALIGYNLLFGTTMTVRSGTLAFVKIGAVFALATSWPAYRTIVYDLVTNGPNQLVSEIGPRAGVVGTDGTLVQRLDLTDRALVQLAILGPGMDPAVPDPNVQPRPFSGFDAFALGGSRILFLLTAIAALSVVRIVAGLMLALGPFFIAFLMFDGTRSLFEGWVRVLGGAALSAIGASIALGLELGLLDPWLSSAVAQRMAGQPLPTISTELFVISALFAIVVTAMMYGCARVAWSFRLPITVSLESADGQNTLAVRQPRSDLRAAREHENALPERTRAAAIANLLKATGVRGSRDALGTASVVGVASRPSETRRDAPESGRTSIPLGKSFSRRPGAHVSARAARRDQGA